MKKKLFIAWGLFLLLINLGATALVHSYLEGLHAEAMYTGNPIDDEQLDRLENDLGWQKEMKGLLEKDLKRPVSFISKIGK